MSDKLLNMNIKGSCHCGKTTISTNDASIPGIIRCYCRDCQKHLGNFAPWVVCKKEETKIDGEVGEYQSSEDVKRLFCTNCGASVAKRPDQGENIVIAAGIFDQPLNLNVVEEVFIEAKEGWM